MTYGPYIASSAPNQPSAVDDTIDTCGLSCSTSTPRYSAISTPPASAFVSIRRYRMRPPIINAGDRPPRYTFRRMLFDVAAEVTANTRLSPDYNVIALHAPDIARAAEPGQFVMIKPQAGLDPLLRRPFSIFERLCDAAGDAGGPHDPEQARGRRHRAACSPSSRAIASSVLGPLGRAVRARGSAGGSVDGGRRRRARAVCDARERARGARHAHAPVLRRPIGGGPLLRRISSSARARALHLTTEDGSRGERGRVIDAARRARSSRRARRRSRSRSTRAAPRR